MGKTVSISDDIHILVTKKKADIFEKYRITVRISDIVNASIKYGIDNAIETFTPNNFTPKLKTIDSIKIEELR